ncbi:MAG: DUF814 domain-containing protein [Victivallales bacterium]|nr:DUF814 domain-containing protein [Victivallales bacterium]
MPRKEYVPPVPKTWNYDAGDGWLVFAGKTDEDNDILSMQFARPNDYWFHVRALPGSHVILRAPEGCEETPSRARLELAAAVAAWHSKARNGGNCAVSCTLAKFVSKPRGAKPGLVEISHETILKVRPSLPNNPNSQNHPL